MLKLALSKKKMDESDIKPEQISLNDSVLQEISKQLASLNLKAPDLSFY